jgi:hypothetical protein
MSSEAYHYRGCWDTFSACRPLNFDHQTVSKLPSAPSSSIIDFVFLSITPMNIVYSAQYSIVTPGFLNSSALASVLTSPSSPAELTRDGKLGFSITTVCKPSSFSTSMYPAVSPKFQKDRSRMASLRGLSRMVRIRHRCMLEHRNRNFSRGSQWSNAKTQ